MRYKKTKILYLLYHTSRKAKKNIKEPIKQETKT